MVLIPERAAIQTALRLLVGSEDLVSRLITGINRVTMWFIGDINLLTKFP